MTIPDPKASQAVLIGVSTYDDSDLEDRPALANGVHRLKELLCDETVWGLPEANCAVITDDAAVQAAFDPAVKEATQRVGDGGALIVYYGGHAKLHKSSTHVELRLSAKNSDANDLIPWWRYPDLKDRLSWKALGGKGMRVLLLDCCYSGHATKDGALSGVDMADVFDIGDMSGLFTASTDRHEAYVPAGSDYSAFAGALITLLDQGSADFEEHLSLTNLDHFFRRQLAEIQSPQFIPRGSSGNKLLFRNRGYVRQTAAPRHIATVMAPTAFHTGREDLVAEVADKARTALAAGPWIGVVHGRPSLGKTELVRSVVKRLHADFPDARLELDLYGWTPGQEKLDAPRVLERLLRDVGQQKIPHELSDRAADWRRWLRDRRVLLVLDNVHPGTDLTPLRPPDGSTCAILLTSRASLSDVDAAARFALPELTEEEAIGLLRQHLGPDSGDAALRALALACGKTPGLLSKHGAKWRGKTITVELAEAIAESFRSDPDEDTYRAGYLQSVDGLKAELLSVLYACARHPGPDFNAESIAAMTERSVAAVTIDLNELERLSLLQELANDRYSMHDLDWTYALELAEASDPAAGEAQRARLYQWLLKSVEGAGSHIWGMDATFDARERRADFETPLQARRWLTDATGELEAAARGALDGLAHAPGELITLTARWLLYDDRYDAATRLLRPLIDLGSPEQVADAHRGLGDTARMRDDHPTAQNHYQQALTLHTTIGNQLGQANAHNGLGDTARMRDDHPTAQNHYQQALTLHTTIGNQLGQANAHNGLGDTARLRSDTDTAQNHYQQALTLHTTIGNQLGQANTHDGLGDTAVMRDDHPTAEDHYQQALTLHTTIGNQLGQANAHNGLGHTARMRDDHPTAQTHYQQALTTYTTIGNQLGQANAHDGLGDTARMRNDYPTAQTHYQQALTTYTTIGDQLGQANTHDGLGHTARMRNDYPTAQTHYQQALTLHTTIGNQLGQANAHHGLGLLAVARNDPATARRSFATARDLYRQLGNETWAQKCQDVLDELG